MTRFETHMCCFWTADPEAKEEVPPSRGVKFRMTYRSNAASRLRLPRVVGIAAGAAVRVRRMHPDDTIHERLKNQVHKIEDTFVSATPHRVASSRRWRGQHGLAKKGPFSEGKRFTGGGILPPAGG